MEICKETTVQKVFFKTGSRVVLAEEEPKVGPPSPFFHKKK